ncbi:MAG: PEP-CTERM sorting domain-containing protein [Myxococcota bacterium]
MRILTLNLLAAALLLFGAASASAFAVDITVRGATSSLTTSDTVTVDVYLDADGGITIFSVAVVNSNPAALLYDAAASAALAPSGSGPSGAQPSYILYTPAGGRGVPALYLQPLQTPAFLNFPPETAGTEQVNINFTTPILTTQTTATGTGIYVASLVFHVVADFAAETISLAFTSSNLIQAGTVVTDPLTIGIGGPITLTGHVPEPTTAMLIGIGIIGLGLAGRRRA